jgi:hypothetical protein
MGIDMRKQYHFRETDLGLASWDVHRLVDLSRDFPRLRVPLDQIRELDENYWFDENDDRPTCRRLAEHMKLVQDTSLEYPIILSSDGRVMDGMHRVVKALVQGLESIEAVRFTVDPGPDYVGRRASELPY